MVACNAFMHRKQCVSVGSCLLDSSRFSAPHSVEARRPLAATTLTARRTL